MSARRSIKYKTGGAASRSGRRMSTYSRQRSGRWAGYALTRGGTVILGSGPRGIMRAPSEPGYVDLASATYALDSTGSITLLNTVPQGAGTSQRVGKKIALKSLQCRGYMYNNATATVNDITYVIVYDKRPTGVLPAITDILVSASPLAFNNDTNSGRFRILKRVDKTMIGSAANQWSPSSAEGADWFLSLRGLPQVFKAAGTGAIGDIEEGAIYLITMGGQAAGTTASAATLAFRLRYHDV